jgi:hypothetical protein
VFAIRSLTSTVRRLPTVTQSRSWVSSIAMLAHTPSTATRRIEFSRGHSRGSSTPSGTNITTLRTQLVGGTSNGVHSITDHHCSSPRQATGRTLIGKTVTVTTPTAYRKRMETATNRLRRVKVRTRGYAASNASAQPGPITLG